MKDNLIIEFFLKLFKEEYISYKIDYKLIKITLEHIVKLANEDDSSIKDGK